MHMFSEKTKIAFLKNNYPCSLITCILGLLITDATFLQCRLYGDRAAELKQLNVIPFIPEPHLSPHMILAISMKLPESGAQVVE